MKIKTLKPLLISMAISVVLVLGGWIWNNYFFEKGHEYLSFAGAIFSWVPGAMILDIFGKGKAAVELDFWFKLAHVISFVFWVIVFWAIRKVFILLKNHKNKKQTAIKEQ